MEFDKGAKKYEILYVIAALLVSLCTVIQPILLKNVLDADSYLLSISVSVVLYIVSILGILLFEYFSKYSLIHMGAIIRSNGVDAIIKKYSTPDYVNISSDEKAEIDVDINSNIDELISGYYENRLIIITTTIGLLMYGISIFYINKILVLLILAPNIITILIPKMFESKIEKMKEECVVKSVEMNSQLSGFYFGNNIIKNSLQLPRYRNKLNETKRKYIDILVSFGMLQSKAEIIIGLFSYLGVFCIILFGAYGLITATVTVGTVAASLEYCELIAVPIICICDAINSMTEGKTIKKLLEARLKYENVDQKEFVKKNFTNFEMANVTVGYRDEAIVSITNIQILPGEKYVIWGDNGSGKSTLLKTIYKATEPISGTISINGMDYNRLSFSDISEIVTLIAQNEYIEEIKIKDFIYGVESNLLNEFIELPGINENRLFDDLEKNMRELSGGEQQLISLLRAMNQRKDFLIIDEGLNEIHPEIRQTILKWLLTKKEMTIIYVTHDKADLMEGFEKIEINNGRAYKNE